MKIKKILVDFRNDGRVPERDKKTLLIILGCALVPILIIPGWISTEGFFISLFIFSFIPDYLFNILDQTLLLSLYPYDMKSYNSVKRMAQFITMFTPTSATAFLWQYKRDVI